jgi:mannitol/fructose-specific phosphotransferase system IIA component (Ntr-type)
MESLATRKEMREQIRSLMNEEGIWNLLQNMKIYSPSELIQIGSNQISQKLITMLENVNAIQKYCDEQIIELKN